MMLVGQYDSPFVRRAAIALRYCNVTYAHAPWSVFRDSAQVAAVSPLGRVPILVLDDGSVLPDSHSILAWLDSRTPLLAPQPSADLVASLARLSLSIGLAEKSVALVYEAMFHPTPAAALVARLRTSIAATLAALGANCAAAEPFWHGEAPGHADIALACAARFTADAHPDLDQPAPLRAHAARCEALPHFIATYTPFSLPPAGLPATPPT